MSESITAFSQEHAFLSNFYPVPGGVQLPSACGPHDQEPLLFPTVEHAYVAAKSQDFLVREIVAKTPTPGKAKRLGALIELRPDWEEVKIPIMTMLLAQKFAVGTLLADQLLSTGVAELVEGNKWCDVFWGCCECPIHCPTGKFSEAEGDNRLGILLMKWRKILKLKGNGDNR